MLRSMRVPILITLAAAACGDGNDEGADAVVATTRDSAGVAIVENPMPPDSGGTLALAAEPEVTIGVLEGAPDYQLDDVAWVVRLSDGRIVVTNGGTNELRYYGPDGRHLLSAGGEGEGPGEFRGMGWIATLPGDSLVAYDHELRRVLLFDHAGEFVRSIPLHGEMRFPFATGMTDPDHIVFQTNGAFERIGDATPGVVEDTLNVHILPWRDSLVLGEPAFRVPGDAFFLARSETFASMRPLLLTGNVDVLASGGYVHVAPPESWEVRRYTSDGALEQILRREHEPVPVTGAMWNRAVEAELDNVEQEAERTRLANMIDDMPRPAELPPMGSMTIDRLGRVWVERNEGSTGEVSAERWDVFDVDGQWLAVVTLPPRFRPTDIGEDWVLGVSRDELDVQQVRLYRLTGGAEETQ